MAAHAFLLALGLTSVTVLGAPIEPRTVIAHTAVVGLSEAVPSDIAGTLYLKYKPYLRVINGCVPFPAVDANGNTGGGLSPTGGSSSGCSSSPGQVYARGSPYNGQYAIMYSWYMPKDSPSDGLGHRHDWENAVVWLSSASTSSTILGLATSQDGGYATTTAPKTNGSRPLVGYVSYWPVNHQIIADPTVGGSQPLVAWESLPSAARTALENTDFGDATVPFKESTFAGNLAKAIL